MQRLLAPAILTLLCFVLLLQKIDLSNADLGRHLKNGEMIVYGSPAERSAVLYTNAYSYAEPEFPFVNHHWLSGVVLFGVWKLTGFEGLTVFYGVAVTLAFLVSYWIAMRASRPGIAAPLASLALPLVAWRFEVRPEMFTYLLMLAFLGILMVWQRGHRGDRVLYWLPVLMLVWVNLHVGFVFGFVLLAVFGIKEALGRKRLRPVLIALGLSLAAGLANPSGVAGFLYPATILGKITYPVSEAQSLMTLRSRGLWTWPYEYFVGLLVLTAVFYLWRWLSARTKTTARWPDILLLAFAGLLSVAVVRNIPQFCLLAVPVLAVSMQEAWPSMKAPPTWRRYFVAAVVAMGIAASLTILSSRMTPGLGLKPGLSAAADFLRANNVEGPIFNDFDLGSYLTFHLVRPGRPPMARVYVDGRPEAYPPEFFEQTYIPMLTHREIWTREDERFHFSAIAISLQDGFPAIERFILTRVRDSEWAPVFADDYAILFLRQTSEHAPVIEKHRIPRERFR